MNRLQFLKRLGIITAVVAVAPDLLIASKKSENIPAAIPAGHKFSLYGKSTKLLDFTIEVINLSNKPVCDVTIFDVGHLHYKPSQNYGLPDHVVLKTEPNINYVCFLNQIQCQPQLFNSFKIETTNKSQRANFLKVVNKINQNYYPLYPARYITPFQEDLNVIEITQKIILDTRMALKISILKPNTSYKITFQNNTHAQEMRPAFCNLLKP